MVSWEAGRPWERQLVMFRCGVNGGWGGLGVCEKCGVKSLPRR